MTAIGRENWIRTLPEPKPWNCLRRRATETRPGSPSVNNLCERITGHQAILNAPSIQPIFTHHQGTVRRQPRRNASFVGKLSNIPLLNSFPGPGSFPKKGEAGFNSGIKFETTDRDAPPHLQPAILLDQLLEDVFQGDTKQGIPGM